MRLRGVVHLLSGALFGRSLLLPDFPRKKSIVGIGLSDSSTYAGILEERLSYTNTFLHAEPYLDILDVPAEHRERYDFVISADVFEHVPSPVIRAFEGAHALLKRGGHLILTVPFGTQEETVEHYPDFFDFRVVDFGDRCVLVGRGSDGVFRLYDQPVFHGGLGATLEMRTFARRHILSLLAEVGFTNVAVDDEGYPRYGIVHDLPWGQAIVAQRHE